MTHAYGTNGIITEVEMPLTAAYDWVDVIVGFDDFMKAARFANALAQRGRHPEEAGHRRRRAGAARLFHAPPEVRGRARASCIVMVAPHALDAFLAFAARAGGESPVRRCTRRRSEKGLPPVFELAWNHTTLRALRVDPTITYLQALYPFPNHLEHGREDDATFRRRGAAASRIRALRRQDRLLRPAAGPLHHRGAARRDHRASTRTMAARSSTRTATRWRRAA